MYDKTYGISTARFGRLSDPRAASAMWFRKAFSRSPRRRKTKGIPMSQQRFGIITGGGDAPGLNAVIRAVVKTAAREYGARTVGIKDGFDGVFEPDGTQILTPRDVRGILPRGGTILGTANRGNPFAGGLPAAQCEGSY